MTTTEDRPTLAPFEGKPVESATIAIRNTGDGLSKAMEVDPTELHHGQRVYVVLECEVDKVRFDPLKDEETLERVHVLKAGRATFVDADVVAEALDAQQRRIEEAAGVQQLPLDGEDPEPPADAFDEDPDGDDLANLAAGGE